MPIQTITGWLAEGVPAWLFTGAILVGGYMYDKSSVSGERLAVVETKTSVYEDDVTEIKGSIVRIESILMERGP